MTGQSNLRPNHKPKWQRNNMGGYTLMVWKQGKPYYNAAGAVAFEGFSGYQQRADIFKPKKGNVWIARWLHKGSPTRWQQGTAPTMREAMRLAQFMVGLQGENT